jgi:CO/xanthine dehydrogenase Mo-binding subunit
LTDWLEEGENLRGIGIALGFQGNGLLYPGADKGSYGIEITLTKESDLEINTSMTGSCDDFAGLWAGIAAEILSIEPHKVYIVHGSKAPDSGPSCASRNITALTKLVEKCCMAIRKQRFRDPLPITIRRSVKAQSSAAWKERFPPPDGKLLDTSGFSLPGQAAAVVEVTIDSVELIPKIRGVWLAIDGGRIISEDRARRSLAVSTAGALGWAFAEHIEYTDGVLSQSQFENYSIPGPADIPPIFIDFLWNDSQEPRGIGELPFNCIPAAFLQAVSQAMDHRFNSIPLKPEDIWEAGKLKKTEKTP